MLLGFLLLLVGFLWFFLPIYIERINALAHHCKQQKVPEFQIKTSSQVSFFSSKMAAVCFRLLRRHERRLFQSWDELVNLSCEPDAPPVFFVSIGKTVRLFVSDPFLLRELLITNAEFYCKPSFVKAVKILGNGLFSSCGNDWARQRPLLLPAFLTKKTKIKVPEMAELTNIAVEKLSGGRQLDVHQFFLELSLDVLNKTGFGSHLQAPTRKLLTILNRYVCRRIQLLFSLAAILPGYSLFQRGILKQTEEDERWIVSVMSNTHESHRAVAADQENRKEQLIDVVVRAGESNSLKRSEVLDNCITFLLAGHETTARLLTWTFYLLAINPEWQQRAREEAFQVLGENPVRWEDISELKSLSLIIMESLRLYPPQPLVGRVCMQQNKLGDYSIPAGLEIIVPVAAIHRSQKLWGDNAREFRPERFENGIRAACSHPMGYLPFGTGPRTCIGQTLATTQAKVVISTMIRRFKWKLSESYEHHPEFNLNLQPKFGMPVVLESLDANC